ncbi:MAG: zeta toxin family protein [Bacteroidales bacterium]|nr:zeta toxin family protein [Bacteroidales bacterium]MDY0143123.1 zeta toxin family protein [Bacteroidales bacterium]
MPQLIIIAGCNGAGKSTYAPSLLPNEMTSFDYDKLYLANYNSLPDSEYRDKFAKDKTTREFERLINFALENKKDFCYETNFDTYPLHWASKFKDAGFTLNLIFFCLESQEIAKHRVLVRAESKGHFVDNKTINFKWKAGYKNVNRYYDYFDNLLIIDNSKSEKIYTNILQIKDRKIEVMTSKIPDYFQRRFPSIYELIY